MARPKRSTQPADPQQDAVTSAVATNLARLRGERAWSLDVLAGRAGVSKAMLHQIESGRSVPTIAVVWRIAQGLNVPFSDLLARPAASHDTVLRRSEAKWLTNAEGSFASRALFPFDGPARSAEFYELRLKPGAVEEAAAHAHATIEHLAVSAGTIEVTVGGEIHRVAAGDCLVFNADRPHGYRNSDAKHDAIAYLMMTYALPGQIHA